MRVALFSGNYNYLREGANQALNRLVSHAERNGVKYRVYSPVTDRPAFEPAGDLVAVPSVPIPGRSEFRLGLGLSKRLRDDIATFAPDLIHVSAPDILGTRAQTYGKRLGLPIVASFHTRFETYFRHYGLDWLRPLAEAHLRRFYRRSDLVLAPTPAIVEEMKALRSDSAVGLWSRGVDRDLFRPDRRDMQWRRGQGFADDDLVLLFFGRLVLEKGVKDFVAVAQALRSQGMAVRTLVVGAGPARDAFAPLDDVVLTGHLEGLNLARAIASADILLHPSRSEAFGNVVLEAMASGLAIVSADADSSRQLIEHGRSGILCTEGTHQAFADAVIALGNSAVRRDLGAEARKASRRFSWDAASDAVLDAYRRLV